MGLIVAFIVVWIGLHHGRHAAFESERLKAVKCLLQGFLYSSLVTMLATLAATSDETVAENDTRWIIELATFLSVSFGLYATSAAIGWRNKRRFLRYYPPKGTRK